MNLLKFFFLVLFSACSLFQKPPEQKQTLCLSNETMESSKIKWVKKKTTVARCRFLQTVEVGYCDGTVGQRALYHLQVLKAKVADAKGNYLLLEDPNGKSGDDKLRGEAYQCPSK